MFDLLTEKPQDIISFNFIHIHRKIDRANWQPVKERKKEPQFISITATIIISLNNFRTKKNPTHIQLVPFNQVGSFSIASVRIRHKSPIVEEQLHRVICTDHLAPVPPLFGWPAKISEIVERRLFYCILLLLLFFVCVKVVTFDDSGQQAYWTLSVTTY